MNLENLYRRIRGRIKYFFYNDHEKRHALSGDPDYWQENRHFQFEFLLKLGLKPHHRLLDFGCGTLVGGIPLITYLDTGCYYGVDIRPAVIEEGRREIKEHQLEGKQPNLYVCESITSLSINVKFDYIFAFFVLGLLDMSQLKELFQFISGHLNPDGAFYANIRVDDKDKGIKWYGFDINVHPMTFYKEISSDACLKLTDIGSLGEYRFNYAYNIKTIHTNRVVKLTHF